jgi:phosphatidylglycerophosphate synthase
MLLALNAAAALLLALSLGLAGALALVVSAGVWFAFTLAWLALHLTMSARPARGGLILTHPTMLTLVRAMALPLLIAFSVGHVPRGLWVLLLVAYWVLDVLDGQWARRRGQTTLAGTMLDGWVDMGTTVGAGAVLSFLGLWPPHLLALLVLRFLVPALVGASSLARGRTVRFRSTVLGKLAGGTMVLASVWPLIGAGPPPAFWLGVTLLLIAVLLDQSRRALGEPAARGPEGLAAPDQPAVDQQGDAVDIAGGR